jgi:hypothetical protein
MLTRLDLRTCIVLLRSVLFFMFGFVLDVLDPCVLFLCCSEMFLVLAGTSILGVLMSQILLESSDSSNGIVLPCLVCFVFGFDMDTRDPCVLSPCHLAGLRPASCPLLGIGERSCGNSSTAGVSRVFSHS